MMSTQNENSTSTMTLSPEVVCLLIADLCLPEIDAAYHINVNSPTISNVPNDIQNLRHAKTARRLRAGKAKEPDALIATVRICGRVFTDSHSYFQEGLGSKLRRFTARGAF